jgi:hypothetical protein
VCRVPEKNHSLWVRRDRVPSGGGKCVFWRHCSLPSHRPRNTRQDIEVFSEVSLYTLYPGRAILELQQYHGAICLSMYQPDTRSSIYIHANCYPHLQETPRFGGVHIGAISASTSILPAKCSTTPSPSLFAPRMHK